MSWGGDEKTGGFEAWSNGVSAICLEDIQAPGSECLKSLPNLDILTFGFCDLDTGMVQGSVERGEGRLWREWALLMGVT